MNKRKKIVHALSLLCCALLFTIRAISQPYVDPLQVRYMHAFKSKNGKALPFSNLWVGSNIPLKLKENTYLLISPYYEQWDIAEGSINERYPTLQSATLPIGLIFPIGQSKWSVTAIGIVRSNASELLQPNSFQYGSAVFGTYTRKPNQKFKLGMYANTEFFGLFIIPLVGIDWRINDKDYLFALLPGRLAYEHKWNEKLFGGARFRSITNSYRLADGRYVRLNDIQLSAYLDYYLSKKICLTLEPGFGLFRKIRTGIDSRNYSTNTKWGNSPFIKLSSSYRIRL